MTDRESATINRLIKKMDSSSGFAALGVSVQTISRLGDDVDCDTREITQAILHDAALTAKLLRIANSSRYARGGHNVSTIDQVLAILGLSTVKSVSLSLALLDSLPHTPQSKLLHAEIVAANFCGCLAYEVTHLNGSRFSAQEAQICGLMQNIGRMMSTYYLYADIESSRQLQAEQNLTESEAITQTLGVSFETIGAAIARHWELPDIIQNSLAPDTGEVPVHAVTNAMAWNQHCSSFCRRVTEILFRLPESSEQMEIGKVIDVFYKMLHLNEKDSQVWIEKCLLDTDTLFTEMSFPCNVEQARGILRKGSEQALDLISSQDSLVKTDSLNSDLAPIELIKHVLRHIHDHYSFEHTLICLPIGLSGLVAIAGVGRHAINITAKFRSSGMKPDIFREIVTRKVDTFVPDVYSTEYAKLIPDWYHENIGAKSFVMLPLRAKDGKLLGMIYGDYSEPQSVTPSGLEAGSMQEWRNQLIHALQSGSKKIPPNQG